MDKRHEGGLAKLMGANLERDSEPQADAHVPAMSVQQKTQCFPLRRTCVFGIFLSTIQSLEIFSAALKKVETQHGGLLNQHLELYYYRIGRAVQKKEKFTS